MISAPIAPPVKLPKPNALCIIKLRASSILSILSIRIVRADSKYKPAIEGTILEAAFAIEFYATDDHQSDRTRDRIPNNHPLSAKKLLSPPVMDKN